MTGAGTLSPKAPDLKQTVARSPFATARRRREQSVQFKKLVAMSLAWEAARGGFYAGQLYPNVSTRR
jgi:hypothetical protein